MKVGDLVKRKPEFGEWVDKNPWMLTQKDLELGIVVDIQEDGYWDYEVLWQGRYTDTHDISELERVDESN